MNYFVRVNTIRWTLSLVDTLEPCLLKSKRSTSSSLGLFRSYLFFLSFFLILHSFSLFLFSHSRSSLRQSQEGSRTRTNQILPPSPQESSLSSLRCGIQLHPPVFSCTSYTEEERSFVTRWDDRRTEEDEETRPSGLHLRTRSEGWDCSSSISRGGKGVQVFRLETCSSLQKFTITQILSEPLEQF